MPSHIIAISGPEGVGKDTLINRILEEYPKLQLGRKATTRSPRPDDCNTPTGEPKYIYLETAEFMEQRAAGLIVEHSPNATGALYGSYVDRGQPGVEIRDLDVNGAQQLYAKSELVQGFPRVILVGILPSSGKAPIGRALRRVRTYGRRVDTQLPSLDDLTLANGLMLTSLEERLLGRGDDPAVIAQKLARATWEIPEILQVWPTCILNDDLNQAVSDLSVIVDQTFDEYAEYQPESRFQAYSAE